MPHAIDPPDAATVDVSATTDEGMGMIRVTTSTVSTEFTIESGSDSRASIAPEQGMSLRFLDDNSLTEMLSRAHLTAEEQDRYNRALANVDILEGFGGSDGVYECGHLVLALLALMRYVERCEGRGLMLRHRQVSLAFPLDVHLKCHTACRTGRPSNGTFRSRESTTGERYMDTLPPNLLFSPRSTSCGRLYRRVFEYATHSGGDAAHQRIIRTGGTWSLARSGRN